MDIWDKLYKRASEQYHPEEVSPFIDAHHVVCAIEAENGEIYTGFCIEGASGVMNLCAERVAGLNMYIQSGQTVVKRMLACRNQPPKENGGMPCGACREFFLQLNAKNKDMEIITDFETRKTITLNELIPDWWGWEIYNKNVEEMFNLINELKTYNPMDKTEESNVSKVLNFLNNNTNCFDRSNLGGHITAGGLVVDMKGNVLLNHHKKTGMWFQFGGHSDGEENSLNVAKREIKEECGLDNLQLISNKIFDVDVQKIDYNAKKNEPEHYHYDINFLFSTNNMDFKVSNESTEIKWVTIEEAKNLISKDDQAMQRMLKKYEGLINYEN